MSETLSLAIDAVLVVMILGVASFSVFARDARTAVIGFMAFGLLLGLGWVRLGAVDVALTETAIGALTGVILIGASAALDRTGEPASPLRKGLIGVGAVATAASIAAIVLDAPAAPPNLSAEAVVPLPSLGIGNAVTAVLLAYRALDTLLETVVVLLALVAVWSLARDEDWRGAPAAPKPPVSSPPLDLLARLLPGVGFVVAVHVLWTGADAPGGKFQAATILAAMWLLAMMAGLRAPPDLGSSRLRALVVAGPAVFLLIGLAGFLVPGSFLAYPEGWAKPLIVVIEVALTVSIGLMLGLIVLGPGIRAARR